MAYLSESCIAWPIIDYESYLYNSAPPDSLDIHMDL